MKPRALALLLPLAAPLAGQVRLVGTATYDSLPGAGVTREAYLVTLHAPTNYLVLVSGTRGSAALQHITAAQLKHGASAQSLTKVLRDSTGNDALEVWSLAAPDTGNADTVVVTYNGTVRGGSMVQGLAGVDSVGRTNSAELSFATTLTGVKSSSLVVLAFMSEGTGTVSSAPYYTEWANFNGSAGAGATSTVLVAGSTRGYPQDPGQPIDASFTGIVAAVELKQ